MYTFLFRCPTTGHKMQGAGTLLALIWVVPLGGADRLRQASDGKRTIPCYHRPMLPTARVPDNLPTPTNSFVIFVMLCLFVFGLMAFAKFMQQRERKRRG